MKVGDGVRKFDRKRGERSERTEVGTSAEKQTLEKLV